jgi:hypothetical protein
MKTSSNFVEFGWDLISVLMVEIDILAVIQFLFSRMILQTES